MPILYTLAPLYEYLEHLYVTSEFASLTLAYCHHTSATVEIPGTHRVVLEHREWAYTIQREYMGA